MTRWYWLGGLVTALVFVIVFINPSDAELPPLPPELQDQPDIYMEDAVITQYEPDGNVKYRLASKEITHFEHDELTRMSDPKLDLHDPPEPPWRITSRRGVIQQRAGPDGGEEEEIFLEEDVVMRHEAADRYVNLATSTLYVYPDRQYAETDQAVIIQTNTGRTIAGGFRGDLERRWMQLSSSPEQRVHVIVLPGQFK